MIELKPCPFCGGEANYDGASGGELDAAGCPRCNVYSTDISRLRAANHWNTRPTDKLARAKERYEAEKALARRAVESGALSEIQRDDVVRIAAEQILNSLL